MSSMDLRPLPPRFPGRYKSFTDSLLCIALLSRIISLVVLSASFRSLIFQLAIHIWYCKRDSAKVFVDLIVRGTEMLLVQMTDRRLMYSVIRFENCVNGYSVPLRQKSVGHNSNAMGQNCNQDKL